MRKRVAFVLLALLIQPAWAAVFINEVFLNPPGSSTDDFREFIELQGPPGMKLDGYAVAFLNGGERRDYPLGSIPPSPAIVPEIDEFFSLDGLQLGANGLLVLGIGGAPNFPLLLPDTAFAQWHDPNDEFNPNSPYNIWNGWLDAPGKLGNDGSNTIMLIRNRPGITEADPSNPLGLRWGKDIAHDTELITPLDGKVCIGGATPGEPCSVTGDCLGGTCGAGQLDRYGNGNIDKGTARLGLPGDTLDLKGASTPEDLLDDLEIVDEVSYEHGSGWEYDEDDRLVDVGGSSRKLPPRRVHTLDDPNGINPDALTRVDYRTAGSGWVPVAGAAGQMSNGRNWQDTATEQWVRGESIVGSGGAGSSPQFFFDNGANADPDAVQPYLTNVPMWLADGLGTDYNFGASNTYQIMAGRVNPLAMRFIPGDVDRDGVCNANDITRMKSVFGNENWIFSNGFEEAPEGDSGDPAVQYRPWDLDLTGDNGIEPSDFQWILNFQGDTTGRVFGVRYDSTTPSATGVRLNSNAGVACTITTSIGTPPGSSHSSLKIGDLVQVTIAARVTSGVNTTSGQQNGIMQYVLDLLISPDSTFRVIEEQSLGSFVSTRAVQSLRGDEGSLGIESLNGYTTSFTQGLTSTVSLSRVTLRALQKGTATILVAPASLPIFTASTPHGLKVGHTDHNGNPASSSFPTPTLLMVTRSVRPDFDGDGDVDAGPGGDLAHLAQCWSGPAIPQEDPACIDARLDDDNDIDQDDFGVFQRCYTGEANGPPPFQCDAVGPTP